MRTGFQRSTQKSHPKSHPNGPRPQSDLATADAPPADALCRSTTRSTRVGPPGSFHVFHVFHDMGPTADLCRGSASCFQAPHRERPQIFRTTAWTPVKLMHLPLPLLCHRIPVH